jgi:iron complex transport system permease protein
VTHGWAGSGWSFLLLWAALIGSVVFAITIGPADISSGEVWFSLGSHFGLAPAGELTPIRNAIIWDLRLPRVLAAAAIGAGLSLCGAVMQALTRNPLADPYLLGLSSGAAVGATIFILLGATALLSIGAFIGAALAMSLTLLVARLLGGATPSRTVLSGIAVSALASSMTSLLIFWSATGDSYREILNWLLGSLSGVVWVEAVAVLAIVVVVGTPMVFAGRLLDAFAFGDTAAATLGVDVSLLRWTMLTGTALLTGVLVSVGGAIGFVGLIMPHLVRLACGAQHRVLLSMSMLLGAIFMVWTDTAARTLFDPRELPVGIITALIGSPIFLAVLMRFRGATQ